jgi:hypothetical protein
VLYLKDHRATFGEVCCQGYYINLTRYGTFNISSHKYRHTLTNVRLKGFWVKFGRRSLLISRSSLANAQLSFDTMILHNLLYPSLRQFNIRRAVSIYLPSLLGGRCLRHYKGDLILSILDGRSLLNSILVTNAAVIRIPILSLCYPFIPDPWWVHYALTSALSTRVRGGSREIQSTVRELIMLIRKEGVKYIK